MGRTLLQYRAEPSARAHHALGSLSAGLGEFLLRNRSPRTAEAAWPDDAERAAAGDFNAHQPNSRPSPPREDMLARSTRAAEALGPG